MHDNVFARLGRFAARRPRAMLAAWVVLLVATAALGNGLQQRLGSGGFEVPGSESLAVQHALQGTPGGDDAFVVVRGQDARAGSPKFDAALARVHDVVAKVPGVAGVTAPAAAEVSPDRRTVLMGFLLRGSQSRQIVVATHVLQTLQGQRLAGFTVQTGGRGALYSEVNRISKADLEHAELISFPVTAVVLLLAFGGLVAAGLPLVLGLASLCVTLGALFLLSGLTPLSIYVTNSASIIGIGVGIDYALFVLTRYREERARDPQDAIARTMGAAGRTVTLSGATVVVALSGLFLMPMQGFRSMGLGCVLVVAVAVGASLTLLPALLALLGSRIDRAPRRRPRRRRGLSWEAWAALVMRRPARFLAFAVVLLAVMAVPLTALHLGQPSAKTLPAGSGPRVALAQLSAAFGPGRAAPVEILVDRSRAGAVPRLLAALRADPGVVQVRRSLTAGRPRITVIGRAVPQSDAGQALVRRIRERIVPAAGLAGSALTGGAGAADLDLTQGIRSRLPYVIATVLLLSFIVLAASLRSLVLPIKAVAMNLLSVGAAYGLVVAVFQWGWGAHLLGFTPEGQIQAFVPLFLFCVLFGLSMDYEVLLLTRVREEWLRTGDPDAAVGAGLARTGRTVTSAALVMVTVFAAFAGSRLIAFKAEGLGLAFAIAIDALLIRVVAVPASMKLLGKWNWWLPARLGGSRHLAGGPAEVEAVQPAGR